jgi:two-component system response regulator NreC
MASTGETPGESEPKRRARVMAIDDRGFTRSSLRTLELAEREVEIIEAVRGGRDFLRTVRTLAPDVIVMDGDVAHTAELADSIAELKRSSPPAVLLILTTRKDDASIDAALRAGANGYLLKEDARAELHNAVRNLLQGKMFLSPSICNRIIHAYLEGRARRRAPAPDGLTSREREVLALIAAGYRNRDIAQQLSLSHKTIEKHRSSLMRKLNLRTVAAVAAYAVANGYVSSR